jgi:hypothetical protein
VLTGFDRLRVGAEVHFAEEGGRDGPRRRPICRSRILSRQCLRTIPTMSFR